QRHRWITRQIDSRTAKMADKAQIERWIEDYGEDSDFVRVRVKGEFPRAASNQFIPSDLVEAAAGKSLSPEVYRRAPGVLGVDVARFGDDQTVLIRRQGLAAFGLRKFRGLDTMAVAGIVAQEIVSWRPDAVFVDAVGLGAGVVDRLRQLGHAVIAVNSGERAAEGTGISTSGRRCGAG
ncbi:MAG: terminase, partial [Pseudomonadota bacterium]